MTKLKQFEGGFASPDRRYAVYQIIHGGAANPSLAEHFDDLWFGGIVGNVPYRAGFPDDTQEWEDTARGMREFIRRGMHTWIYDEDGYPSGTAGGYITEFHPEFIAKGLYCYDYWRTIHGPSVYRADVPGDRLWKAVLIPVDGGDPIDVTHMQNERGVLYIDVPAGAYYLFMMSIRRLFDGTHATEAYSEPRNYISLSDRRATEAFLAVTHEKYKEQLSDTFGDGVLAMFTDEPSLISWNIRSAVFPILPWLDSYPEDFEAKYGYPFVNACVAVVLGRGNDVIRRRCDFWDFIADTVADNYFGVIADWCHKNHLKSSGHMLEEERLQAHIINYGSFYRSMQRFDWPGIDQLQTEIDPLMHDGAIPIARFVASFADINGEHEVFTEFSDHCVRERGEVAGKDCYYGSVNWHLAMGVNNFTSYYSWEGLSVEEIRAFNQYTARSGYLLRQGIRVSRVAVFYPEAAMWASYTPSVKERGIDWSEQTRSIDIAFARASWDLLHRQVDFDYIDRKILCAGEIRDGKLCYRDRAYAAIVLPCTRVLELDALNRLHELENAGIAVLFCGEAPTLSREYGEPNKMTTVIGDKIALGRMHLTATETFGALLDEHLPEECRTVTPEHFSPMLLSHCRITPDGVRIVYLANMDNKDYTDTITVAGRYTECAEADAFTGEIHVSDCIQDGENTKLCVTIRSGEGRFFLFA